MSEDTKQTNTSTLNYEIYIDLNNTFYGCNKGLKNAMSYLHDSFMIKKDSFCKIFENCAYLEIESMKEFAKQLHQLRGQDDKYYDVVFNDTPEYCNITKEKNISTKHHNTYNDLTAVVMLHLQKEKYFLNTWEKFKNKYTIETLSKFFNHMIECKQNIIKQLRFILEELKDPHAVKDFGIMPESDETFALDSGNYFDKPNPIFIQKS